MDPSSDGPTLLRPTPRRPFEINLSSPSFTGEDRPLTPPSSAGPRDDQPSPSEAAGRLLDPRSAATAGGGGGGGGSSSDADSLSRAASFANLTASTLFGIYLPTAGRGPAYLDVDDDASSSTPWGTGARTPAARPSLDDDTLQLMRRRSKATTTTTTTTTLAWSPSTATLRQPGRGRRASTSAAGAGLGRAVFLLHPARTALLFALGLGYGVLVSRLQGGVGGPASEYPYHPHPHPHPRDAGHAVRGAADDWRYLLFWGAAGVVLGGLLPWFDGVWEQHWGRGVEDGEEAAAAAAAAAVAGSETDWALVMRGIGAFVGIVFAIRKLPWTSTMQVSLTLALANPFLWYIVDRSKPGFWLSAAVGLVGSAVLTSLNPEMVPAPMTLGPGALFGNSSSRRLQQQQGSSSSVSGGPEPQATFETGIWMVSVLFCSCIFFGNIGRRLAVSKSSAARGRWGGVR